MSKQPELESKINRILVAVDSSKYSLTALKAAAELAALMQAELQALFVEDINLLRLCGLPFSREIGSYSATSRQMDSITMEREFRVLAVRMRRAVAQTAVSAKVNWTFQVTRGSVTTELLAASEAANLLTLGHVGRSPGKRFGSTAQSVIQRTLRPVFLLGEEGLRYPLLVVYSGSPASERALQLAVELMRSRSLPLRLLMLAPAETAAEEQGELAQQLLAALARQEVEAEATSVQGVEHLLDVISGEDKGTLILPAEQLALLERVTQSVILVP